ncbi:MAG: hypothetical protein A3H31_03710 [Gallionellales bacterium RIFCSPLOWO2_02_FULL_57_47]|nr:MAG: hypothetical protein A3H31_03710 [Gallionellales bacterium RIFCSPLOWO2_02_FULL_57_47]OGT08106.1 MAG: hypothetical protein A3J49_19530 [Gallionellales bacterium RIFCSPHIGHO2_02_FULL_57_16]
MRSRNILLLCAIGAILTGCGAGTPDAPASTVPSLAITLTNGGVPVTSITSGTPATVKATLKDASGAAVAGAVVTFSTDQALATITPAATALTDTAGVATVTLSPATVSAAGATAITATSQVGTTALTGTIGYSVGGAVVTITNPVFGVNPLSAFGTTSVAVTVSSGGISVTTPQTVTFSSPCASSGKAVLSASVVTVNGNATGSYRDNGCAGTDTITASVSGIASSSATLTITAPTAGSIQYVTSAPANISLKGTGGIETAQVTFKVLDTGGIPLSGKTVSFGLSTTVGGITLTPGGTATSDASGLVVTNVNAGTVSTPVRVTASTCTTPTSPCTGTTLSTQSSQLTITTGIPDQFGFSLSAPTWNVEGWNVDGTTTVLTARLADHFKNPVPDNTAVVFTAEAGSVVGTCSTVDSACSVSYTSQGTRPSNGRVSVLAYAVGEETFTDLNGSGWADLSPNEMVDPNGNPTDLPEAFVDYNEDGVFDPTRETFIDFNGLNGYDAADTKFSGVLCDDTPDLSRSSAGTCSPTKTVHVRQSGVIVVSSSSANITINGGAAIAIPPCNLINGNVPATFTTTVVDVNGNAMPAGTTVDFTTSNGTITSSASYIVPNSIGCRTDFPGCPASAGSATFGDIQVTMLSDAAFTVGTPNTCTNSTPNGIFTVTVTAPGGTKTYATATVTD